MDKIIKLFTISEINKDNAKKTFANIASELFEHCIIKQGDVTFVFLEVEFYFWSNEHQDNKPADRDDKIKPFVYPRSNTDAAQFFIHNSGIDICLKSDNGFGGILLRSLLRIQGENMSIVTGPGDCCDALINYTGGTSNIFPTLKYEESPVCNMNLASTIRANVPKGCTMENAPYCFYNKEYVTEAGKWGYKEKPLQRYNPITRKSDKNEFATKPWNRHTV